MAISYNPRIVTDGLVLALDAGNTKSYPGSGTTWFDLSGKEHNFTATTISTASDATAGTVYDHDNSTVASLNTITPNINHEVWSLMFWVRSTGTTPGNYRNIIILDDTSSIPVYFYNFDTRETTNSYVLGYQKHYDGTVSNNQWMSRTFVTSSEWATGDWFCIGVSHNNTAFRNYKNGQLLSTQTQTLNVTGYGDLDRIRINNNSDNTVRMGPVLLYDRILTDDEFKQNFNATRGRFGI